MKYNVDDPKWCAITYFLLRNFCSASAIIFLLFANDFIERHDLICFVFARSMKRSSLTCCDERISILSENSHCSNLGGRLFRLNSHTVYNKYKCCRRRLTPFKSCRHATHRVEEQASKKITPKKKSKGQMVLVLTWWDYWNEKNALKKTFQRTAAAKPFMTF